MSAKSKTQSDQPITEQKKTAPNKPCPNCKKSVHTRTKTCPHCGHKFEIGANSNSSSSSTGSSARAKIDKAAFVKVLAGKGFKFVRLVNTITGELVKEESDKRIDDLGPFEYLAIPRNADNGKIYITQTSNQVQVSMSLDKFLQVTNTKA